jgi:biotin transport system substrate-specific component
MRIATFIFKAMLKLRNFNFSKPMRATLHQTVSGVKPLGYALLFAALTALAAWVEVPMVPVPMTMQTCAVLLSGALLGARWGAVSQVSYLVGGVFLPIYAGGAMGISTLFGATGGYLLSFPLAAYLVGWWLREATIETSFYTVFARIFAASLLVMIIGTLWLQVVMNLSLIQAVSVGFVLFIIGDAIKCSIVAVVVKADKWISTHKPNLF